MDYGQKIAELRKNKKLTQAELGTKLNLTAQAVSKWENNLSEPDIDSIRKMCEIFEVSVDEFLGLNESKKDDAPEVAVSVAEQQPVKAILGYCEKCKKAVCAGEFKTSNLTYNASAVGDKVKQSQVLHTYCNSCMNQILTTQKTETKNRAIAEINYEKAENRKNLFKGLIWGGAVMIVVALIYFLGVYPQDPTPTNLLGAIVITLAGFCIPAQIVWEGVLIDVFLFFCRSFKAPFGLIFELSLDGILWLLTVKLALWILCGLLSIAWFIIGIFVTIICSVAIFPFSLGKTIYEINH